MSNKHAIEPVDVDKSAQSTSHSTSPILVVALYLFTKLPNCEDLQVPIYRQAALSNIKGTILIASEGINGTVSGSPKSIYDLLTFLKNIPELGNLTHKESWNDEQPFQKLKVLIKNEIVNLGVNVDPTEQVGEYIPPSEWNQLIEQEDVILIDTRNDYEIGIGTFKHAIDPNTRSFKEFPNWVNENLQPQMHKRVAMYCTGGIRCEKATSYLLEMGFEHVYHLEGGILKYLEEIPKEESLWKGECFVFDERVSVDHQLQKGQYILCPHCGNPTDPNDMMATTHRKHCPYFTTTKKNILPSQND